MLPYALLSLLMTFYTRMDAVLLRELLVDGDIQNGIYASAYRLLEAANMMASLVAMLLLPMFSKMIASKLLGNSIFYKQSLNFSEKSIGNYYIILYKSDNNKIDYFENKEASGILVKMK